MRVVDDVRYIRGVLAAGALVFAFSSVALLVLPAWFAEALPAEEAWTFMRWLYLAFGSSFVIAYSGLLYWGFREH